MKAVYYHPAKSILCFNQIKNSNKQDTKVYFVAEYLSYNVLPVWVFFYISINLI